MGHLWSTAKKHKGIVVLVFVLIALDIYWRQLFYTILLAYGLFIKLIFSNYITSKYRKILAIIIWSAFIAVFIVGIYVNYYLPHGPSYPTGDIVCQNDDRGPCAEAYAEDMSKLDIPSWAKEIRGNGLLLLLGLLFAGMATSIKKQSEEQI